MAGQRELISVAANNKAFRTLICRSTRDDAARRAGDRFVKYIIYMIIGAVIAVVALRYFNSRRPPRQ